MNTKINVGILGLGRAGGKIFMKSPPGVIMRLIEEKTSLNSSGTQKSMRTIGKC